MRSRHFPLWTLLGVVLVSALLIGSGAFSSSPPTNAQRAAAIESVIKCPSCEDLSVAVSTAPTAVTVRATVRQLVDQGRSDQQIEDYLAARYGSAIVLEPPASGWSLLVWALPIAAGLAGLAVLVVVLVRRRRRGSDALDADVRGPRVDPAVLEERRRFLTQSLADADAEYLAGDLSDADYLALRQRDLARLAGLPDARRPTEIGEAGPGPGSGTGAPTAPATRSGSTGGASTGSATGTLLADRPSEDVEASDGTATRRRRRNRWFLIGSIGCFVVALIVAVPVFSSGRLPGQTATGSVSLSPSQQVTRALDQAAAVEDQGQLGPAAQLYQSVLDGHPDNEVALAQLGWLEYRIGQQGSSATLIGDARAKLHQAAVLDPGDYAVHLYQGTLDLQLDKDASAAVGQFTLFLAARPPATVVSQAAPVLRQAYAAAGTPLPAGVPTT
ncbi:MAG TPA: cytochrome c-type biogenesis protein CcmH [Acidimicrobiales bacterium]